MASDRPNVPGWRDLNSRPLDPKIGCPWLSSLNHLSLLSMVNRRSALSAAVVVLSWSVVSPRPLARS